MIVPGSASALLLRTADTGYKVERSLRFNSSDSAYLSRTPASAGNRKTWTWSGWVKNSKQEAFPNQKVLLSVKDDSNNHFRILFLGATGELQISQTVSGSNSTDLRTSQVFRDFSAWWHICVAVDTNQATAANRFKLYVNGAQVTAFGTATYQGQGTDTWVNSTETHYIARHTSANPYYFDGYLADVHFIDGQALTPSSFTEVSATTGQLIPKAYTGTFTGNSFWLKFADNSAATATTLGKDSSGLGNNWSPSNLSVTAGAGNDSLVDTPTNYGTDTGAGGEVRGNYATLNPLAGASGATLSNGNLDRAGVSGNKQSTIGMSSGKWYWEVSVTDASTLLSIGVTEYAFDPSSYALNYSYASNGSKWIGTSNSSYGASYTAGDVIFFSKNGTWQNSGNPVTGVNPAASSLGSTYAFFVGHGSGASTSTSTANFGQRPFAYTAPSGFKALCTTNLPDPVVAQPSEVFDTVLWTGNNTGQTITMPGSFSPDLVWTKTRNVLNNHWLFDVIRGANQGLSSSSTTNELTRSSSVIAFGSTGFTLGTSADVNSSSYTYVGWCWDAGSSTVTNTQGSITSSVRANASAGFSIVSWNNPTSGASTVGHGLGVAPQLIIMKPRNVSSPWFAWHTAIPGTSWLNFSDTSAVQSNNTVFSSAPTSTIFSLGTGNTQANYGTAQIAYCFAPVAGYSSFGSYTGNGSSDGPFVYTGFRPRWILLKRTNASANWAVHDTARAPYNAATSFIFPNKSEAEVTSAASYSCDILSNGFKPRNTGQSDEMNISGSTYIYAAFAESPFQYARAR